MTRSLAAVAALLLTTGCYVDSADCTPTNTRAKRADKVNVGAASRSAVIEATLTSRSEPLSGKSLTFEVLDDDASVYTVEAATGANGTARADLKRADPDALLALVRADAFRASFGGDGTYCSSSGRNGFRAVRA